MITSRSVQFEVEGRLEKIRDSLGKTHVSVRWEPAPRIVRVGVMLDEYDWDRRMEALGTLREFEADHADEFAVEYDIVPLESVTDSFAEA